MANIELVDKVTVRLVQATENGDMAVCAAAWVESSLEMACVRAAGTEASTNAPVLEIALAKEKLIGFLLRHKHGTPFEHNLMTFWIDAPIFVWREFHRHRIGFSYNEVSGRYKQLAARFWSCPPDRALVPEPGYKATQPKFVPGTEEQLERVHITQTAAYKAAYTCYEDMLADGVAKEVARSVLPVSIMSQCWVTCNARSVMHFLALRTHRPDALFVSYPQREIEQVAEQIEGQFARLFPITHKLFCDNKRVAP